MSSLNSYSKSVHSKAVSLNYDWPFPDFHKPQKSWKTKSRYCILVVGITVGKFALSLLNTFKIRNKDVLLNAIYNRPSGTPLITVSNHESCMDDPALIACASAGLFSASFMNLHQLANQEKMRWSMAAHDICFRNALHSKFFSYGKCIPTVRGLGVYQRAVDFAIERLNEGDWLHVFPEGKVNMERKQLLRLKWGIGRIISELKVPPMVIPFWHTGMADVLPNRPPYVPRFGKTVMMNVGQPLEIQGVIESVSNLSAQNKRKIITDFVQEKLDNLRTDTLTLYHNK